jgi:hypothetical protein
MGTILRCTRQYHRITEIVRRMPQAKQRKTSFVNRTSIARIDFLLRQPRSSLHAFAVRKVEYYTTVLSRIYGFTYRKTKLDL